ncbi:MAG: aminotransferase class V-fold PLP-dependent enzyme, partial [Candidatus Omnitrophica bacterium]|nr:aminotransferase class V-fold PLP-dependent enzyme [Candidatus Omnitrophota bacterium]
MSKIYHLDAPNAGRIEKKYLTKAIDSGYISTFGPFVGQFEKKFAKFLGAKKAVALQSGTAALHMSLLEAGIGDGDEVIVPCLTFVATVNPVLYVGAKPVLADVSPDTWNIQPEEIESHITTKTKAIIPVHLFGTCCDMGRIMEIAQKYNLVVIEDSTESLGVSFKGKQTGMFGNFGCFSFNGNKLITTGGGGMIVSEDEKKIEHIRFLINQAADKNRSYYHPEIGFNYRMTNIEAALGLAQLERINSFLDKKRKFTKIYQQILGVLPYVEFQKQYTQAQGARWLNCMVI